LGSGVTWLSQVITMNWYWHSVLVGWMCSELSCVIYLHCDVDAISGLLPIVPISRPNQMQQVMLKFQSNMMWGFINRMKTEMVLPICRLAVLHNAPTLKSIGTRSSCGGRCMGHPQTSSEPSPYNQRLVSFCFCRRLLHTHLTPPQVKYSHPVVMPMPKAAHQ
jgi:hypothetical protein